MIKAKSGVSDSNRAKPVEKGVRERGTPLSGSKGPRGHIMPPGKLGKTARKKKDKKSKKKHRAETEFSNGSLSLPQLRKDGAVSTLVGVRTYLSGLEAAHHSATHQALQVVGQVASILESDIDLWLGVCTSAVFDDHPRQRPKPDDNSDALKIAIRLAVGFGRPADKRASKYHTVLSFLKGNGVRPTDVGAAIGREGGIEVLAAMARDQANVSRDSIPSMSFRVQPGMLLSKLQALPPDTKATFTCEVIERGLGWTSVELKSLDILDVDGVD
jgi:hypothetical protein